MTRPSNIIYGVDDRPPALVCLANAAQQLTVVAPFLVYTILVMRGGGASEEAVAHAVSLTFVMLGIATILQALPGRWIGSGYLVTAAPAAAYIPISIAALKAGGVPLLAGMTMLAGAFEVVAAQIVRRFRPFFPTEISGLCVLLIGIYVGVLAIRAAFGIDPATGQATATGSEFAITAGTLALMIGLNLWGRGLVRMLCAIIGVICGYAVAALLGAMDPTALRLLASSQAFALPTFDLALPAFSLELVIPFMAAALTCALRAMGDITAAQKVNDRDWLRPDMISIRKGIMANGVGSVVAGALGVIGGNTQSASVGLSNATGVTSRWVAVWLGGIFLALSLFPIVSSVLVAMPRSVIGASFVFLASFIMIGGLQIITSRLLDPRRTFIVGISLTLSLGRDIFPALYQSAPPVLAPFTSSGLVIGLVSALVLNALFRIGVTTRASLTLTPGIDHHDAVRSFLEQQGAKWGARRDVVERAIFGTAQAVESIGEHCAPDGPITVEASFDEFSLDVRVIYRGEEFVLPERRPSDEEIRETDEGLRLLAGYLIQQNADRVRATRWQDCWALDFHFQH